MAAAAQAGAGVAALAGMEQLAALKQQQQTKEAARVVESKQLKDKTKGSKLAASMNFNQDCVIC